MSRQVRKSKREIINMLEDGVYVNPRVITTVPNTLRLPLSNSKNTRMTPQREDNYQVAEVSNVTAAPNVSQQNAVNKIVINIG